MIAVLTKHDRNPHKKILFLRTAISPHKNIFFLRTATMITILTKCPISEGFDHNHSLFKNAMFLFVQDCDHDRRSQSLQKCLVF